MGKILENFLLGTAGNVIGTGMGLLMQNANDRRQLRQQEKLQKLQIAGSKELTEFQNKKQMEIWEATNYRAQMHQLKMAGLNPGLIYGSAGAGGTLGGAAAQVPGATAPAGGNEIATGMGIIMQNRLLQAQIDNIKADTKNKETQTPGILTENENKILEGIVIKYAGQEAKRQWSINNELTAQEYGAKSDELEARSAVANLLIKLHEDGTMQKLTEADLNKKIQEISKGKLDIDGKKLENAILELEKEMQTKLGIDRSAPTWLKMIGRLIQGFIK